MAVLAAAVGIGGGLAIEPIPAMATETVSTSRVAGADRFETAAEVAKAAYPTGTNTAIVASGRSFPDALAGAALAGLKSAPVLLTEPTSLPKATSDALTELKVTTVYVLGGTAAVSSSVSDSLASKYTVTRLAGADRYETAKLIANEIGSANVATLGGKRTAIVATGLSFADALAGGPLAAAGASASGVHPILLVNQDVPSATNDALTALNVSQVVILGGTAAVSSTVETKLESKTGNPAIRYAGTTRFATARQIGDAAETDFGFDLKDVLLARGLEFPDALAGGPLGAIREAPVLLVPSADQLGTESARFLDDNSDTIERITALGGTAAIGAAVLTQAEQQAENVDNDADTNVEAPAGAYNVTVSSANKGTDRFVGCATGNGGTVASGDQTIGGQEPADGVKLCRLFEYDSSDSYSIGGTPQLSNGLSNFEAALSPSDAVSGNYQPEPADQSSFGLTDAAPLPPESAAAAANSGGTATVTFAESNTPTTDEYRLYRAPATVTPTGTVTGCPDFNSGTGRSSYGQSVGTLADPSRTSDTNVTLSMTDNSTQGNTAYCYAVTSADDSDESNSGRPATGPGPGGSVTTTADLTAPQSDDATVRRDDTLLNIADTGDEWRITFTEPIVISTGTSPSTLTVRDGANDTATVTCVADETNTATANEAKCTLNGAAARVGTTTYPAGAILTVKLLETLDAAPAGLQELNYPLTVTAASNVRDAAGNPWTPADDPDNVLENTGDTSSIPTQPAGFDATVDARSNGSLTAVITFTEPIDTTTLTCDSGAPEAAENDVTLERVIGVTTDTVGCLAVTFSADKTIASVTFDCAVALGGTACMQNDTSDPLQTGDRVTLKANSVKSATGTNGPSLDRSDVTTP